MFCLSDMNAQNALFASIKNEEIQVSQANIEQRIKATNLIMTSIRLIVVFYEID